MNIRGSPICCACVHRTSTVGQTLGQGNQDDLRIVGLINDTLGIVAGLDGAFC